MITYVNNDFLESTVKIKQLFYNYVIRFYIIEIIYHYFDLVQNISIL